MLALAVITNQPVGAVNSTKGQQTKKTNSEEAVETFVVRKFCLEDLERAKTLKICKKFLPPELTPEPGTELGVHLCKLTSSKPPCNCKPNGADVECRFRICGYKKGFYNDPTLRSFAAEIAENIQSWGVGSIVATRFIGFADGVAWEKGKLPKPQPVSDSLLRCLRMARVASGKQLSLLGTQDLLDADLALLRGCLFEDTMRISIPRFEFDSLPSFSFEARRIGVEDPSIRAAELEVVVGNGCRRLAHE